MKLSWRQPYLLSYAAIWVITALLIAVGATGQLTYGAIDQSAAVNRAVDFLGLAKSKSLLEPPSRIKADTTRLIRLVAYTQIGDSAVATWVVEFDSTEPTANPACASGYLSKSRFRVVIDQASGGLLEVFAVSDQPVLDTAAEVWRRVDQGSPFPSRESERAVVTEPPEISFLNALVLLDCPDACTAQEVVAYLIDISFDADARPVVWDENLVPRKIWWITIRKHDVAETDSIPSMSNVRLHTFVVDAHSGEVLHHVTAYLNHPFSRHRH